eukprot:1141075-Amphidinium_carterae.2
MLSSMSFRKNKHTQLHSRSSSRLSFAALAVLAAGVRNVGNVHMQVVRKRASAAVMQLGKACPDHAIESVFLQSPWVQSRC